MQLLHRHFQPKHSEYSSKRQKCKENKQNASYYANRFLRYVRCKNWTAQDRDCSSHQMAENSADGHPNSRLETKTANQKKPVVRGALGTNSRIKDKEAKVPRLNMNNLNVSYLCSTECNRCYHRPITPLGQENQGKSFQQDSPEIWSGCALFSFEVGQSFWCFGQFSPVFFVFDPKGIPASKTSNSFLRPMLELAIFLSISDYLSVFTPNQANRAVAIHFPSGKSVWTKSGSFEKALPKKTDIIVMTERASMAPVKTALRPLRIANNAAMKNVLSPISETSISANDAFRPLIHSWFKGPKLFCRMHTPASSVRNAAVPIRT